MELTQEANIHSTDYIYLASPYSHPDLKERIKRYNQICKIALELMQSGERVFCPIAHSHPIDPKNEQGMSFWIHQDTPMLYHASKVVVAKLPGWEWSKGVAYEIALAEVLGKPVEYLDV